MASPYKPGRPAALRRLCDDPAQAIRIDIAHTYAIAGYGKDEVASTLVLLAVYCSVFGHHSKYLESLEEAYGAFREWCTANRKTTSIQDFSKEELKIKSLLDNHLSFVLGNIIGMAICENMFPSMLIRLKYFPRGLGKGFDAALMGSWLESVMSSLTPEQVPDTWMYEKKHKK